MRRKGFVLMEVMIAIGVAMIVLPGIVGAWVSVQRMVMRVIVGMHAHTEQLYGLSVVEQTVRDARLIVPFSEGILIQVPGAVVTFRIKDGQLRREQMSGGKSSVAILVRRAQLQSLSISNVVGSLVRVRLVGNYETVVQDVWASQLTR